MTGPVVTPDSVAGISRNGILMGSSGGGGLPNNSINASELNSFRVSAVIERLSSHAEGQRKSEVKEFFSLCLSLARGIDFAVANHELPSRSNELPSLLKLVCQNRSDVFQQAAIMVLMISVKSACQHEWFSSKDTEELMNLAKEIGNVFSDASNFNIEPSCSLSVIPTIISRFLPKMRMGHVFASLEVKPGFDAYVADFQIPKDLKPSPGDKIRLFVAQTDNIETSSCLITPAKVNFLLNGKPVEKRTSVAMDPGPQVPTIVSQFLKYGSNLLQAVGEFNGNYIIAVALMSELPSVDCCDLKDYEQLDAATMDSDSEVILGPSRISLNCPISFKRINTPVKGHSCNHIQCFDFNNYVDINSRRPSWRCPHCNQHVCISDLRIDRKMVKILEEVGTDVSDIIISLDGLWKPVIESGNSKDKQEDESAITGQEESLQPADILDLTKTDDVIDSQTRDSKHVPNADQCQFMGMSTGINPYTSANINDVGFQIRNGFSSGPSMSTFGLSGGPSNVVRNAPMVGTSFPTDPLTSLNTQGETFHNNVLLTNTAQQTEISLPTTSQLQQHQFGNSSSIINELGRLHATARNVSRPTAAFQTPASVLQQSYRSSVNSFGPTTAPPLVSPAVQNIPIAAASPVVQHHRTQQNTFPQHQQSTSFQNPNQASHRSYRVSNEQHTSSQQMGNLTTHRSLSSSAGLNQSSVRSHGFPSSRSHINISAERNIHGTSSQQAHLIASADRSVQMAIDPRLTASFLRNSPDGLNVDQSGNTGASSQPVQRTDASEPVDMNWRPASRMRGALSGQAYTNALNEYIIRPGQQAQVARPISNVSSLTTNFPPQLQAMMTGGVGQGTTSPPNCPLGQTSRPG